MHENRSDFLGNPNAEDSYVPDLFLERYLLGELPSPEKSALERRLENDSALQIRLETLRKADVEYAQTHDVGLLAHGVRERMRRESFEADQRRISADSKRTSSVSIPGFAGWRPLLAGAFLLALVAVPAWHVLNGEGSALVSSEVPNEVVAVQSSESGARESISSRETPSKQALEPTLGGGTENTGATTVTNTPNRNAGTPPDPIAHIDEPTDHDGTRLKGFEPTLALFRRTEHGAEPLKPGTVVKPGDVVRIGYRTGGRAFGAILSVDGSGNVTRHWPTSGDVAVRLGKGETLLPGAFELDAAPDYERFYLITSEKPFDLKPVLEALHADKAPKYPHVTVVRFDLLKENGI